MIAYLHRYYAFSLVVALLAPLWFLTFAGESPFDSSALHDAVIWTALLLGCWLLITKRRGFEIRGNWRRPTTEELSRYRRLLIWVLLVDFGSKAFFFQWDRPHRVELFKNFGLHSVFHVTPFEPFHLILSLYFLYVFLIGALFFRFSSNLLDRAWMVSSAFALGGAIALFSERLMFGGVHNSFYLAGSLMWICPPCASSYAVSYAWTPADFFVHAAFMPAVILFVSYLVPPCASTSASN